MPSSRGTVTGLVLTTAGVCSSLPQPSGRFEPTGSTPQKVLRALIHPQAPTMLATLSTNVSTRDGKSWRRDSDPHPADPPRRAPLGSLHPPAPGLPLGSARPSVRRRSWISDRRGLGGPRDAVRHDAVRLPVPLVPSPADRMRRTSDVLGRVGSSADSTPRVRATAGGRVNPKDAVDSPIPVLNARFLERGGPGGRFPFQPTRGRLDGPMTARPTSDGRPRLIGSLGVDRATTGPPGAFGGRPPHEREGMTRFAGNTSPVQLRALRHAPLAHLDNSAFEHEPWADGSAISCPPRPTRPRWTSSGQSCTHRQAEGTTNGVVSLSVRNQS